MYTAFRLLGCEKMWDFGLTQRFLSTVPQAVTLLSLLGKYNH